MIYIYLAASREALFYLMGNRFVGYFKEKNPKDKTDSSSSSSCSSSSSSSSSKK